jgi:voltage-gated potassium channel
MHSLTKLTLSFSYFLASSSLYQKIKFFTNKLLNVDGHLKHTFDVVMIILVLVSVFLLMYEVNHPLDIWMNYLQDGALVIFILEYLGRLWTISDNHKIIIELYEYKNLINQSLSMREILAKTLKKKIDYMSTPLAIIDLLAILPSYRPLRVLRIFLLFRLFKLFRYTRSVNAFFNVLAQKKFELYTLTIFLSFVVFASSAAIYIFEVNGNEKIDSFFDAVYWSLVTVTTVGYGDITPHSSEGRFITIILILSGLGVISFATSIIVSAFNEKLEELKENRVLAEVEKLSKHTIICGFGRVGQVLAKRHLKVGDGYVIIDRDEKKIALAKKWGYLAILGDATHTQILLDIGAKKEGVKLVPCAKSDEINIFITVTARAISNELVIISRVTNSANKVKFLRAGASDVIAPYEMLSLMAVEHLGASVAPKALEAIISGDSGILLEPIKISREMYLCDKLISEISLVKYRISIFGIIEEGKEFLFNPHDSYTIKSGDILLLFGRKESIERVKN